MGYRKALSVFAGLSLLVACETDTPYYKYKDVSHDGWEKNDSISFDVPSMKQGGSYKTSIGLRVNATFPFKRLCLVIDKTTIPGYAKQSDTLFYNVTDDSGKFLGQGQNVYQYELPLKNELIISKGDSLHFTIRHNMKRSIMPGILDVGIKISR